MKLFQNSTPKDFLNKFASDTTTIHLPLWFSSKLCAGLLGYKVRCLAVMDTRLWTLVSLRKACIAPAVLVLIDEER